MIGQADKHTKKAFVGRFYCLAGRSSGFPSTEAHNCRHKAKKKCLSLAGAFWDTRVQRCGQQATSCSATISHCLFYSVESLPSLLCRKRVTFPGGGGGQKHRKTEQQMEACSGAQMPGGTQTSSDLLGASRAVPEPKRRGRRGAGGGGACPVAGFNSRSGWLPPRVSAAAHARTPPSSFPLRYQTSFIILGGVPQRSRQWRICGPHWDVEYPFMFRSLTQRPTLYRRSSCVSL